MPLFAIGQRVGHEQTAFAAHLHAFEPHFPTGDYLPPPLHELERLTGIHRGIELGAVAQPARVVDGVFLSRFGRRTGAHQHVDVAQGRGLNHGANGRRHAARHLRIEALRAQRKGKYSKRDGKSHVKIISRHARRGYGY